MPGGADGNSGGLSGPDVFVSYSRADEAFVRRLDAALRSRGKDVWVDWDDIPATADWRARIHGGIESSRAFLAVLSPDLLASEVCAEELDHATATNKRVVPVLRREIERAGVREELLSPNWIFFRDRDDFDGSVERLVAALETDLGWLDAHARLLVRATEWERAGHDGSFLLRGSDLKDAETWLAEQGSHREAATPLQAEFVVASRRGASRRQRALFAGVALALAVAVVLGVVALIQRNDARDEAEISRSRELAASAVSQLGTDPEVSLLLAREALDTRRTPQAEDALVRALRASHLRLTIGEGTGPSVSARFSPDGSKLVTASGNHASVRDAFTGKLIAKLSGHRHAVTLVRFSPDGTRIVTAGDDGTVRIWDARTGGQLRLMRAGRELVAVRFSPDGTRVLAAGRAGARLWNARTGRLIAHLRDTVALTDAIFSSDGTRIVTTGHEPTIGIWDGRTGRRLHLTPANDQGEDVYSPSLTPDGKLLVTASWDDARVWNARTGKRIRILHAHEKPPLEIYVQTARFSADGRYAVTAGADGTARVWSVDGWFPISILSGHAGNVFKADFSEDASRVVTVGDDGTARVWDSITGEQIALLRAPGVAITGADLSRDGNRVVTATRDGVRVWEVSGFKPIRQIAPAAGPPRNATARVRDSVFAADGKTLATLTERPAIDLWNAISGRRVRRLADDGSPKRSNQVPPESVAFSPDGSRVVTIADGAGIVWNTRTGERVSRLRGRNMTDPVFTPDGIHVLTAGNYGVRVFETETGKLVRALGVGSNAAFSPDGTLVAAWKDDHAAVWRLADGSKQTGLAGTREWLQGGPAFSPDGTRVFLDTSSEGDPLNPGEPGSGVWDVSTGEQVATFRGATLGPGSFDGDGGLVVTHDWDTAQVWDARTGEPVVAIRGHGASNVESLSTASLSPDGRLVLTGGADGTAKVWDAATGDRVAVLRQVVDLGQVSVESARFSPDGALVAVAAGPTANVYACEECRTPDRLVQLADTRIRRTVTSRDRERFERLTGD